jgi:hypothetical protein
MDRMEQILTMVYNCIPDSMQAMDKSVEENINCIAQTID